MPDMKAYPASDEMVGRTRVSNGGINITHNAYIYKNTFGAIHICRCRSCAFGRLLTEVTRGETSAPETALQPKRVMEQLAGSCSVDQFKMASLRTEPGLGELLFAHPKSECSSPIEPGSRYVTFNFAYSIPPVWQPRIPDGVGFTVVLRDSTGQATTLWTRYLDPVARTADRGRQSALLLLAARPGDHLVFRTETGASYQNDWAFWSNVAFETQADATKLLAAGKVNDQYGISGMRDAANIGAVLVATQNHVLNCRWDLKSKLLTSGLACSKKAASPLRQRMVLSSEYHYKAPRAARKLWSSN